MRRAKSEQSNPNSDPRYSLASVARPLRVAAVLRAAVRLIRVLAAFRPPARLLRVIAAFRPAALSRLVLVPSDLKLTQW